MSKRNKGKHAAYRKDRNWWGVLEYIDGNRHWHVSGLSSKGEAEAALAMLEIKKRGANITVGEVMAYYMNNHIPTTATPENAEYNHNILKPFWASMRYEDVRKSTFQEYTAIRSEAFLKKHGRTISNDTLRKEIEHMCAAFRYGFANEIVERVPPSWKPPKAPARQRWLTRREAAALLREARKLRYASTYLPLFIIMGIYTAARTEAILTRRWTDIDFENGYIDFGEGHGNKRRVKSPIPKKLLRELKKAKDSDVGFVINKYGDPVGNILKSYKQAAENAGIKSTPHDLRRTGVSWNIQKGVAPYTVAKWAGMRVEMVERVYGHLAPENLEEIKRAYG